MDFRTKGGSMKAALATCLFMAATAVTASEGTLCHTKATAIAVIDLSPHAQGSVANRFFFFRGSTGSDLPAKLEESPDSVPALLSDLASATTNRWLSRKGDVVNVYCLSATPCSLDFSEKARPLQLATDLRQLVAIAKQIRKNAKESGLHVRCQAWVLQNTRANLNIKGTILGEPPDAAQEQSGDVITGPTEHWFLSADVPLRSIRDLSVNKAHQVDTDKTPTSFLIGLDYQVGDLFEDTSTRRPFDGVLLKLLIKASAKPADTYGLGLGLRGIPFKRHYLDLSVLSPFVAWTDERHAPPAGETAQLRARKLVWGVSLNIDKALAWVTPSSNEAAK
jgi:hypothetical protein